MINPYVQLCNTEKNEGYPVDGLQCAIAVFNSEIGEELFNYIFNGISNTTLSMILDEVYGIRGLHLPLSNDDITKYGIKQGKGGRLIHMCYTDPMAIFMDAATEKYVVSPYLSAVTFEKNNRIIGSIASERVIVTKKDAKLKSDEVYLYPYQLVVWTWCAKSYFRASSKEYFYNDTNLVAFKDFMNDDIKSINEAVCVHRKRYQSVVK